MRLSSATLAAIEASSQSRAFARTLPAAQHKEPQRTALTVRVDKAESAASRNETRTVISPQPVLYDLHEIALEERTRDSFRLLKGGPFLRVATDKAWYRPSMDGELYDASSASESATVGGAIVATKTKPGARKRKQTDGEDDKTAPYDSDEEAEAKERLLSGVAGEEINPTLRNFLTSLGAPAIPASRKVARTDVNASPAAELARRVALTGAGNFREVTHYLTTGGILKVPPSQRASLYSELAREFNFMRLDATWKRTDPVCAVLGDQFMLVFDMDYDDNQTALESQQNLLMHDLDDDPDIQEVIFAAEKSKTAGARTPVSFTGDTGSNKVLGAGEVSEVTATAVSEPMQEERESLSAHEEALAEEYAAALAEHKVTVLLDVQRIDQAKRRAQKTHYHADMTAEEVRGAPSELLSDDVDVEACRQLDVAPIWIPPSDDHTILRQRVLADAAAAAAALPRSSLADLAHEEEIAEPAQVRSAFHFLHNSVKDEPASTQQVMPGTRVCLRRCDLRCSQRQF